MGAGIVGPEGQGAGQSGYRVGEPVFDASGVARPIGGDKLVFDGVEVFEPSAPIVNDDNEEGNYYELAVIVPYRYQYGNSVNSPP